MRQLTDKEIHDCLLNILKDVDEFCRQNGLRYSLAYGTLIGAVRHHGFIPWDDDIDIQMPRPDFERFIREYGREPGARYRCLYNTVNEEERFQHFFAKVHDTHTVCIQGKSVVYKFGVNLDVFPIDGRPDDTREQRKMERQLSSWAHRLNICSTKLDLFNFHQPLRAKLQAHIFGPKHWVKKCNELMRRYDFETSNFAGLVSTVYNGLGGVFDRGLFEEYTLLEFEGSRFKAFSRWDEFLSKYYGEYMKLPPVHKRRSHHTTAYLKECKEL